VSAKSHQKFNFKASCTCRAGNVLVIVPKLPLAAIVISRRQRLGNDEGGPSRTAAAALGIEF